MKTLNIKLALVFAAGILIPAMANAYTGEQPGTITSMPPQLTEQQFFTSFDSDRSGGLTIDEYMAMNAQGHTKGDFTVLDINGDGRLSLAELEGIESQRMAGN